ncbi:MAG: hypothetical protein U9Q35_03080 [Pseudomonadota bacterium]|nr:hypothetical protein [Pseudomonadota bacterium]
MADTRPSISLNGGHRLHYTDYDWSKLTGFTIQTDGRWPAGQNIRPAEKLQNATLLAFDRVGNAIIAATNNDDLTPEAKARRVTEAAETYFTDLEPIIKELAKGMATLAEAAPRALDAVRPLDKGDVVAELRDQELRALMRGVGSQERQKLMIAMNKGEQPELVAAVLRGPGVASGLDDKARESLRRVGIVASHHEALLDLRALLMTRDDVVRTAIAGADSLKQLHHGAQMMATRTHAWQTDAGAEAFRDWLNDFQMLRAA